MTPGQSIYVRADVPLIDSAVRFRLDAAHNVPGGAKQWIEHELKAKEPDPKPAKKPDLTLISLKCIFTSEKDTDRAELRVSFAKESASFTEKAIMKRGQVLKFDPKGKRPFDRPVTVELWEINPEIFSKDDKLGASRILPTESGEYTITFRGQDGSRLWKYELKYRVDP